MKFVKLIALILLVVTLTSCSLSRIPFAEKDYRSELAKIKSAAVIIYSVPESINYRKNPKETLDSNLLTKAMKLMAKADGEVAATVAYRSFVSELKNSDLPFSVMSKVNMLSNNQFAELVAPEPELTVAGISLDQVASVISMFDGKKSKSASEEKGAAPESMKSFGLSYLDSDELNFIKQSIAALNVDAAIVVYDPGMSFICDSCVLVSGAGATGTGTTGSSYTVNIIDGNGTTLMKYRSWFKESGETAPMAASTIDPREHEKLYVAHGAKIGSLFSVHYKNYMNKR